MARRELHRLTAKGVANKKTPGRYADGGGLYLQVGPTGTKSWLFRYMRQGKAREMGLGAVHTIPLASHAVTAPDGSKREVRGARDLAADARRLLLEGTDPIDERDGRNLRGLASRPTRTFSDCAHAFIKAHRAGWKSAKHAAQWGSTLTTYAFPALGDVAVDAIDAPAVLRVLEPIWSTKPETATRLRGRIESVLDWATVRGYREGLNPARWRGHLDQTLPRRSKVSQPEHHAALPFVEVPAFMAALRGQPGVAARALEFVILTASRTGEVIGATWDELDLKSGVWTIPAARMKGGRVHRVPLPPAAIEIVRGMKVA